MIRRVIIPKNTDLHLSLPEEYIGKKLEILVYASDEVKDHNVSTSVSSLRGKLNLNEEQYKSFHKFINESRNEWKQDT